MWIWAEHRENEIAKYLEELQTVLRNMEYMKNELLKDYDEAAEQMAEEVKPEIQELFEAVLEQQEISLEHQENSEDFIEEIVDEFFHIFVNIPRQLGRKVYF